jgi:hypothetical protein
MYKYLALSNNKSVLNWTLMCQLHLNLIVRKNKMKIKSVFFIFPQYRIIDFTTFNLNISQENFDKEPF